MEDRARLRLELYDVRRDEARRLAAVLVALADELERDCL
jgi:hypothetical protein